MPCYVKTCKKVHKAKPVKYFTLPKNESLCKKWLDAITVDFNKIKRDNVRICSRHFEAKYLKRDLQSELMNSKPTKVRLLTEDAIPTLFLNVNENLETDTQSMNEPVNDSQPIKEAESSRLAEENEKLKRQLTKQSKEYEKLIRQLTKQSEEYERLIRQLTKKNEELKRKIKKKIFNWTYVKLKIKGINNIAPTIPRRMRIIKFRGEGRNSR